MRRSAFKDVVKATDVQRFGADSGAIQQYTLNGSKVRLADLLAGWVGRLIDLRCAALTHACSTHKHTQHAHTTHAHKLHTHETQHNTY